MNKRHFLAMASVGGLLSTTSYSATRAATAGATVLTISGAVGKANRGALDPVVDQMMVKHRLEFSKAWSLDAAALQQMPAVTIESTLEYDATVHRLRGPLLETVLKAAGVSPTDKVMLGLRAIDGYNVVLSLADARSYRMMIATHLDGQPMALGGLGPQWAVYDADRLPAFKDKPLKERFGLCPWGLYHIDVKASS
jgi:hypothetical protein